MWIATLFITVALAKNVLVIGDSHMAGPFGPELHKLIHKNNDVVTLGHASSAAIHWMGQFPATDSLSGGIFNKASVLGKIDAHHPGYNPSEDGAWRRKVKYPLLRPLMEDMLYHETWKDKVGFKIQPDLVIVELGANDTRAISNGNGTIIQSEYNKRKQSLLDMVLAIKTAGAECIWVGPPDGKGKDPDQVKVLYKLLGETVAHECKLFNSLHFKASVCSDGVHFSCGTDMAKAREWAQEVAEFTEL